MKSRRENGNCAPTFEENHQEIPPHQPEVKYSKNPWKNQVHFGAFQVEENHDIEIKEPEDDVEMRLLDQEMVKSPSTTETEETPRSTKCQLIIAFLGILALIPLIGIVIYLVGMFYDVPDTTKS